MAVLFDLDGTFLDSAPDFQIAANRLRAEYQLAPLTLEAFIPHISKGSRAIVEQVLKTPQGLPDELNVLLEKFLDHYEISLGLKSTAFEGIDALLETLEIHRIPWGIVTNKRKRFTGPLLEKLNYAKRAACIVSGDTTPHSKPHPAPLHHACQTLSLSPNQCIFIGDAEFDIQAGRSAGMTTIAALYGYIEDLSVAAQWGADFEVKTPSEIWERLQQWMR